MNTPFAILQEQGVAQLVKRFYQLMDSNPDYAGIRKMHAKDLSEVEGKLADYLTTWMGGPDVYVQRTGSMCITNAHKPYAIGEAERDQWIDCFFEALAEMPESDKLGDMLRVPIGQVADMLVNRRA